jgi:hypothetical protein
MFHVKQQWTLFTSPVSDRSGSGDGCRSDPLSFSRPPNMVWNAAGKLPSQPAIEDNRTALDCKTACNGTASRVDIESGAPKRAGIGEAALQPVCSRPCAVVHGKVAGGVSRTATPQVVGRAAESLVSMNSITVEIHGFLRIPETRDSQEGNQPCESNEPGR